jgi:hypothetical protein
MKIQIGNVNTAIIGFDIALKLYPIRTNGIRFPIRSDKLPKYPLLNPETNSATPSNTPIKKAEKPIAFK